MRLTIERMRTLVLAAGALLVLALAAFLVVARWKSHFTLRELPRRLGADIQQEANGVTYTQSRGGHTLFKIHASKVVQLKSGGRAILHDVQIELYGEDGNRVDRIAGDEFEYDQKNGIAKAAGPVEITLMRPSEAIAAAHRAISDRNARNTPLGNAAKLASQGEIHVKTSGLIFDQKSGIASTPERVEFAITQGTGTSVGAIFDSQKGQVVLDHAVELDVHRGAEKLQLRARHAEFLRDNLQCRMQGAVGSFRGGQASAGSADLLFREDGSAVSLEATNGFSLTTANAAQIAAPRGILEFNEHNQPRHGRVEGGATLQSNHEGREVHGSAPTADLVFTAAGLLEHAHLERGVSLHSEETRPAQRSEYVKVSRDWSSPVADVDFRSQGDGQVELASVTGSGGVVVSSEMQRGNGSLLPSRLAADQVTANFGHQQILVNAVGTGHASLEQTTSSGAKQTTSGDRIEASFAPQAAQTSPDKAGSTGASQIRDAVIEGHVVLVQQPSTKPGDPGQPPLRATAGRALYDGEGGWLHLLIQPRVDSGGLQLSADKLDISQSSSEAFAHGSVKATWMPAANPSKDAAGSAAGIAVGGQGPAHVVSSEAELHEGTGEATFRGGARLWQQANSISAPVIVLNRPRQTLVARSTSATDPVRVVMVSAGVAAPTLPANGRDGGRIGHGTKSGPLTSSVVRVRCGDLKYSEAERKAVMHAGAGGNVVADTGGATVTSKDAELVLAPAGNHAAAGGSPPPVDRITASGQVVLQSQRRRGTGERLMYSTESDEYVLTGTAANPPAITDPAKGTVSGTSLIFNSRDDSVRIEGDGRKTQTQTVAPK